MEIFLLHLKQAWAVLSRGWKPFSQISPILVAKRSEKAKQCARRREPVNGTWVRLVFWLVISPGNWLYCSIFLTKLSRSSLRGENYTSIYLYQPNVELGKKRYQVNVVRSVFPNPALIGINYIFLFNSVLRLSAIPAYCLGSATDGQTHHFAGRFVYPLKNWPNRSYFPVLWISTRLKR